VPASETMSTSTDNKSSTTENKSSASGPPLTGPNRFVWVELRTDQVEKAKEFYSTLLGWTYSQSAAYASTTFLHQEDGKPPFGSMLEVSWSCGLCFSRCVLRSSAALVVALTRLTVRGCHGVYQTEMDRRCYVAEYV